MAELEETQRKTDNSVSCFALSETCHGPELWLPYKFTSPEEAAEAGVCELSGLTDACDPKRPSC